MIYDTSNHFEMQKAETRFKFLCENKKTIEIVDKKLKRTYKQNRYLHLIIGLFSLELGYTLNEGKLIYKKLSPNVYIYEKKGQRFLRSSADLNTGEMTISIDKFRNYSSSELGVYLPSPDEVHFLNQIETQIKNNQHYL